MAALVATAAIALAAADGGYSHGLIGALTAAVWLVGLGLFATRRWPRSAVPARALVPGALLLAFAAWTALSMLWASDDGRAFTEVVRVLGYLGIYVVVVACSRRGGAMAWLCGLAGGLTVVALIALAGRFDPSLAPALSPSEAIPNSLNRLSFPIGYWNGLAACMALAVVLLTWLGSEGSSPRLRVAAVAVMPLPMLTIFFAQSRGGVAAAAVGVAALLILAERRAQQLWGLLVGGVGAGLLILLAIRMGDIVRSPDSASAADGHWLLAATVLVVVAAGLARSRLDGLIQRARLGRAAAAIALLATAVVLVVAVVHADSSGNRPRDVPVARSATSLGLGAHFASGDSSGRSDYWSAALDAFSSSPIHGIGAGGYELWWDRHGTLPWPVRDAHSLFLQTLAELGLVGLAVLLAFFAAVAVQGVRARRDGLRAHADACLALLAVAVASASIDWTWQLPACFAPAIVAAGILLGPGVRQPDEEIEAPARQRSLRLAIATTAVGFIAVWTGGVVALTEIELSRSHDAATQGDLAGAADDARTASSVEPWAMEPRMQLALVQFDARRLRAAAATIDTAIERSPDDWRPWVVKSVIEGYLGNRRANLATLAKARELNHAFLPGH